MSVRVRLLVAGVVVVGLGLIGVNCVQWASAACFPTVPEWVPADAVIGYPGSEHPILSGAQVAQRWREMAEVKGRSDWFCRDPGYDSEPALSDSGPAADIDAVKQAIRAADEARYSVDGVPWRELDPKAQEESLRAFLGIAQTGVFLERGMKKILEAPNAQGGDYEWVILQWQGIHIEGDSATARLVGFPAAATGRTPEWKTDQLQQRDLQLVRADGTWKVADEVRRNLQALRHPP